MPVEGWAAASPYQGGGGGLLRTPPLVGTEQVTRTAYAPNGTFTSPRTPISVVEEEEATLTSLAWNTTITTAVVMDISMSYRYRHEGVWTDWSPLVHSEPGVSATTAISLTGEGDYFEYRAHLTTTISSTTPLLNWVRIGVLAPPDLIADELTVTGCDTCPDLIPPNQPVQIEFTVRNDSTSPKAGNNFYGMAFITTTSDFSPLPPLLPQGCEDYLYPTRTCALIWPLFASDFEDTDPPIVLTTTYTFTVPGVWYIVAYVDYNDTPANPVPYYDVVEFNEFNNKAVLAVSVGEKSIYLPLVTKNGP